MQLALLRHGVAEDAGPSTEWRDEPRRLTDAGRRRMRDAAAGIVRLGLTFDVVLTSPLTRCVQTVEIVGDALGRVAVPDNRLRPGLDVDALVDLLVEHPEAESVLVCGHQPDLTLVTSDLVSGGLAEFKKGSLAVIELDEPRARAGVLTALYPPSTLRRLAG
jgi:phosphohistidine phosphatase